MEKRVIKILFRLLVAIYPILMTGIFYFYIHYFWLDWNIDILILLAYCIGAYAFFFMYFGNKIGTYRVVEITYSNCLGLCILNIIFFLFLMVVINKPFSLGRFGLMFTAQIVSTGAWVLLCNRIHLRIFGRHRILLIYGKDKDPNPIQQKMSNRENRFYIEETVCEEIGLDAILKKCDELGTIMVYGVSQDVKDALTKYCYTDNKQLFRIPDICELIRYADIPVHIMDTPLLVSKRYPLSVDQQLVKRIFDLVCSLVGLLIASPFMLVTAIAIKLYDGGPVLYKQKRLTVNGKVFEVYKFRSMIVDAEKQSGARLASEHDDRITPVGKVIRAIRFDELPQLFNILKGDMSVVGPRPERPEIAEEYYKTFPEFKYRLAVKAGLTGYAQVYGKYNTTPEDKLKLDLLYIQKYSFYFDLKVIFYTIKILFLKESTEGIEENQTTALKK